MRIGFFARRIKEEDIVLVAALLTAFFEKGDTLVLHDSLRSQFGLLVPKVETAEMFREGEPLSVDLLLALGGDGTILDTLDYVLEKAIPVLGVNLGKLGFLAGVGKDALLDLPENLSKKNYHIEERSLIQIEDKQNCFGKHVYAMNEVSIQRKDSHSLLAISLYVDDEFVAEYFSDGIIVATPTGSTAYSLSCGGPILSPESDCFVITPIAAHTLTLRPIVVHASSHIRLSLNQQGQDFYVGLDSRRMAFESPKSICLRKASQKMGLIRMPGSSFYSSIRKKLMWGESHLSEKKNSSFIY